MPLTDGRLLRCDRHACRFTMMNGEQTVRFGVLSEAMADIERSTDPYPDPDTQFGRVCRIVEEMAQRRFFNVLTEEERQNIGDQEIMLTSNDIDLVPKSIRRELLGGAS